ncbi:MAG: exopolyphosphatase, partial [Gammaproteobacteria bacterium]|nr:exopolyphosphatase [Gammaproteobacteria bacterium]
MMSDAIRIGNCSGYYGDRLAAAKEMVDGGPIDVLTGDYLAELTMTILYNQQQSRGQHMGYVGTFLKQVKDVMATCLDRNIKIVTNAGGLNPKGMADEVEKILQEQGLTANVAYIDGDDLMSDIEHLTSLGQNFTNIDKGIPLSDTSNQVVTANTYFGAWAIKEALDQGADIVICPRVTDAAVVIGPAAWKFNWQRNDYDALAGALAAGHIIECGAQCCGGNYSFFEEVPSFRNVGYPIAEIEADGSFTITKHPGTGGLISVGTVTAQLLYEISTPAYYNPDVIAHFDTMSLEQVDDDRVYVTSCRGSSPPPTHKVCINTIGGFKNGVEILLTGLDIEKKAELFIDQIFHNLGGQEQFDEVEIQLIRSDQENPESSEVAHAALRISVTSSDASKVGRLFSAKITELGLATIPGNTGRGNSMGDGKPVIVYWPALLDSEHVTERLHMGDTVTEILPTQRLGLDEIYYQKVPVTLDKAPTGNEVPIPFGKLFGARSGDKGGCANCGVWAKTDAAYSFLFEYLSVAQLKKLLPDLAEYDIERYEIPNLKAL